MVIFSIKIWIWQEIEKETLKCFCFDHRKVKGLRIIRPFCNWFGFGGFLRNFTLLWKILFVPKINFTVIVFFFLANLWIIGKNKSLKKEDVSMKKEIFNNQKVECEMWKKMKNLTTTSSKNFCLFFFTWPKQSTDGIFLSTAGLYH